MDLHGPWELKKRQTHTTTERGQILPITFWKFYIAIRITGVFARTFRNVQKTDTYHQVAQADSDNCIRIFCITTQITKAFERTFTMNQKTNTRHHLARADSDNYMCELLYYNSSIRWSSTAIHN